MCKRFLFLFLLLPALFTAVSGWPQDGAEKVSPAKKAAPAKKRGASGKAAARKPSTTPKDNQGSHNNSKEKPQPEDGYGIQARRAGQERSPDAGPTAGDMRCA
jgi:hypothetical protein